jgi:dipeptidase E
VSERHIVALGGVCESNGPLMRFMLALSGKARPRVCYLPTAAGDEASEIVRFYEQFPSALCERSHLKLFDIPRGDLHQHLLAQDVICISGGNTANMLAVWHVHGLDTTLREAWNRGTLLSGWSAGAICWFESGVTDSFGPVLAPLHAGLGLLAGSFCPHYDSDPERRPTYHRLLREGLPPGAAAEDAVGLHFVGTELAEAVTEREGARAYRVELVGQDVRETPLATRLLP